MVRFVGKGAGMLKDVPNIIMLVLKQYALSVMSELIPILESVAHMAEFMTMPSAKIKKLKWNRSLWDPLIGSSGAPLSPKPRPLYGQRLIRSGFSFAWDLKPNSNKD
ncbi:25913_t:CDS:2 [Gigaspora margarita]|uniref:25913_t:CDS:1 n=1 Tax=Gigaspora margarita TaxID=4874 RepID=A0ABM8VW65_GIGMA|nr:25913_t:CDS:2 [Gigaspora margarita]